MIFIFIIINVYGDRCVDSFTAQIFRCIYTVFSFFKKAGDHVPDELFTAFGENIMHALAGMTKGDYRGIQAVVAYVLRIGTYAEQYVWILLEICFYICSTIFYQCTIKFTILRHRP